MTKIIILLGMIATFLGFALIMLCGIFSMLHDIKSVFKKETNNTDDEI